MSGFIPQYITHTKKEYIELGLKKNKVNSYLEKTNKNVSKNDIDIILNDFINTINKDNLSGFALNTLKVMTSSAKEYHNDLVDKSTLKCILVDFINYVALDNCIDFALTPSNL